MSTQVEPKPLITAAPAATKAGRERSPQLLCAWFGPAATVLAALGLVVVSGFIPAQHPSASAGTIVRFYEHNTTGIRLGMMLAMIGFTFFIPFGIAIAVQTRRIEGRRPVMTYIQIACVAIGSLEGIMTAFIFATAAFRPGHMSAQITRTLNDLGWFAFLVGLLQRLGRAADLPRRPDGVLQARTVRLQRHLRPVPPRRTVLRLDPDDDAAAAEGDQARRRAPGLASRPLSRDPRPRG
jgi:hypothetical protein